MSQTASQIDQKKYLKLLESVLPRPITSEEQHREYLRATTKLMKKDELTSEDRAIAYENQH